MNSIFSGNIETQTFVTFSSTHIITLLIISIINIILILWFKKSKNEQSFDRFRTFLSYLLLINELFYIVWSIASGSWSFGYSLPLQLCDAAVFLSAYMLLKKQYFCFEIIYFWGLGGGLQALLTPDLAYPFPHIIYFSFFLGHAAVITAIFFMILVERFRPTLKSIGKMYIFTNAYMVLLAFVNVLTDGNYMFLCSKPESASIMDLLGPWPWYILSLEAVSFILCLLLYLPFKINSFYGEKSIQA